MIGETNGIGKVKAELHFCVQTDVAWDYKQEPPNCSLKSHLWSAHTALDPFSTGTPDYC